MRLSWQRTLLSLVAALCFVAEGVPLSELCRDADKAKNRNIGALCSTLQNYMTNANQGEQKKRG
jgi:hypothetical protein